MKTVKRFITFILVVSLLTTYTTFANTQYEPQNDYQLPDNLQSVIDTYFEARTLENENQVESMLTGIVTQGVVNDEVKRTRQLDDEALSVVSNSYEINSYISSDYGGEINITENILYSNSNEITIVEHFITFGFNDDGVYTLSSDSYEEIYINFQSCSYVPQEIRNSIISHPMTRSIGDDSSANTHVNTGDQAYDIIEVARTQIGYCEKATPYDLDKKTANAGTGNYTKYGAWYDGVTVPVAKYWCAMFVSWCANQAGIATSIVGSEQKVKSLYKLFENRGVLYPSATKGGSYIPKRGDIIFFFSDEYVYKHVGIVDRVEAGYVYTIEGNHDGYNNVDYHVYALTNSTISAYASPIYTTPESAHTYEHPQSTNSFDHTCSRCFKSNDASWTYETFHSTETTDMDHVCSFCNTTVVGEWEHDHLVSMEHSCTICNYYADGTWIHNHYSNSMEHTCDLCGYEATGTWMGSHNKGLDHWCTVCGSKINAPAITKVYEHNSTHHWEKCIVCNYTWAQSEHVWHQSNFGFDCLTCGRYQNSVISPYACEHPSLF